MLIILIINNIIISHCRAAADLGKLKALETFPHVTVSEDLGDSENTALQGVRNFIHGCFKAVRCQTTVSVDKVWACKVGKCGKKNKQSHGFGYIICEGHFSTLLTRPRL